MPVSEAQTLAHFLTGQPIVLALTSTAGNHQGNHMSELTEREFTRGSQAGDGVQSH